MTAATAAGLGSARLSTGGILRSEWVKLVTLRSTAWCLAIVAALGIGIPALISLALPAASEAGGTTADGGYYNWMMATTVPLGFSVLVVAVLGCLVITGEYGTGMIRSTTAAVPRRVPVLLAKAAVIGIVVFVVGLVTLLLGALASGLVLGGSGYTIDAGDGRVWLTLLAAAAYPALVAVFAVGVGTLIRNSAGAIAAVLGLLLVVPTIVQLVGGLLRVEWPFDVGTFLPSSLGSTMYTPAIEGMTFTQGSITLEPWQAALALAAWAAAALVAAAFVMRRRDV